MPLYSETVIDELKEHLPEYLETVCGVTNLRRNFHCLIPTHEDNNPSMGYVPNTNYVHCFTCDRSGDVFEVAGWIEGAASFPEKVEAVAKAVGYPLQTSSRQRSLRPLRAPRKPLYDKPKPLANNNFIDGIQLAMQALHDEAEDAMKYLCGRGFDYDLILNSFIGWIKHPSEIIPEMEAHVCDAGYLVFGFPGIGGDIPLCTTKNICEYDIPYVVFRALSAEAQIKGLKPKGLTAPLWREHLLTDNHNPDEKVCVVEGIFDAMSLESLYGVKACATCGAGTSRLLQIMAHLPKGRRPHLVLSFDSDKAGEEYTKKVSNGLKGLSIPHSVAAPYPHGCKDANELLMLVRGDNV